MLIFSRTSSSYRLPKLERSKPTAEDARIMIELANMSSDERKRKAFEWFFNDFAPKKIKDPVEFKRLYPRGSEESRHVGEIMGYFELAGALIENGVLNEDLFFDISPPPQWFWLALQPLIYGMRAEMNEQRLGENFELLYERHEKWLKNHPPKIKLLTA